MARTIFLEHYRICLGSDATPNELGRDGGVIVYEAVDERSREAVALTLVPVGSIDPALRERFEEQDLHSRIPGIGDGESRDSEGIFKDTAKGACDAGYDPGTGTAAPVGRRGDGYRQD